MNPKQTERFEELKLSRTEMETIVVEARIQKALQSKLSPAKKYFILPGDLVKVYREWKSKWKDHSRLPKRQRK